jgi:hypothetical protein
MARPLQTIVEVFHSGKGARIQAPFLLLLDRNDWQPVHPFGSHRSWTYWKTVPLATFAVDPEKAKARLVADRFHIQ